MEGKGVIMILLKYKILIFFFIFLFGMEGKIYELKVLDINFCDYFFNLISNLESLDQTLTTLLSTSPLTVRVIHSLLYLPLFPSFSLSNFPKRVCTEYCQKDICFLTWMTSQKPCCKWLANISINCSHSKKLVLDCFWSILFSPPCLFFPSFPLFLLYSHPLSYRFDS